MEIKLSAGDKITIPTGCKATIEDNLIIIEEKKGEFKEGDILHSIYDGTMIIFKAFGNAGGMASYYNNGVETNEGWKVDAFRHATEEEKQKFFDDLKAKGLRWNAETKTMEKIRKRVNLSERYLSITSGVVIEEITELGDRFDARRYEVGNYYLLSEREQAEEDAKAIKAIFEKRLKVE